MGSAESSKSWTPYDAYKDCAQGICNIYCPQWCNYQPPLDSDDDPSTSFSPLIIAVIGILASAFLLVSYYAIITKYCRRRRGGRSGQNVEGEAHLDQMNHHDQLQVNSSGLDEGLIKSITIVQYKKGVGLVDGTECSVCLSEFQENEDLRLLPKCFHAFHLPCIDTWLKSHSNCPLCRANAAPICAALPPPAPPPPEAAAAQTSSSLTISTLETQRQNDLVLVIDQEELIDNQEICANGVPGFLPKIDVGSPAIRNNKFLDEDGSRELRRSISLGTFSTRSGLMVADILQMNEEDEEIKVEIQQQLEMNMDSSKGVQEEVINGGKSSNSEIPFHK